MVMSPLKCSKYRRSFPSTQTFLYFTFRHVWSNSKQSDPSTELNTGIWHITFEQLQRKGPIHGSSWDFISRDQIQKTVTEGKGSGKKTYERWETKRGGCQERWVMWIKMERPRASLHFCLVKGQSERGKSVLVCVRRWGCVICPRVWICVSADGTPGILERLLLTDLMPLLDMRHVADTLPQVYVCPSKCWKCEYL